jgi:V/A-type H+-transporting ATPase subunit A
VQATLHVVKVFWSLQAKLAQQRHFPAIDWLTSYSFYKQYLAESFSDKDMAEEMVQMSAKCMALLEQEASLLEIVRLVGAEAISSSDRLAIETSKIIREDYLHQNAFHDVDTYTSLEKQYEMLKTILHLHNVSLAAIEAGADVAKIISVSVKEEIARSKYTPESEIAKFKQLREKIDVQIAEAKGGSNA